MLVCGRGGVNAACYTVVVSVGDGPPSVAKVKLPRKVELPRNVKLPPAFSSVAAEKGTDSDSNSDSVAAKLMAYTSPTPIAEYTIALSATTSNDATVSLRMTRMLGSKRSGDSSMFALPGDGIFVIPSFPPIWTRA